MLLRIEVELESKSDAYCTVKKHTSPASSSGNYLVKFRGPACFFALPIEGRLDVVNLVRAYIPCCIPGTLYTNSVFVHWRRATIVVPM